MKQQLESAVASSTEQLYGVQLTPELTRPDPEHGDFATNIAMQLAGQLQRNPREIAEELCAHVQQHNADLVSAATVAGPGFINFRVTQATLQSTLLAELPKPLAGKVIVTEYSDPNPFKVLHAGHLYTTIVGNAVANVLESAGGSVHRVNFGGDVGLHVGKTMWAIIKHAGNGTLDEAAARSYIQDIASQNLAARANEMAARYVEGNNAYEDDESAKQQIIEFNKRVYELHNTDDHDSDFAYVYWTCREWSYDYFKAFYDELGVTAFEKFYPESQNAQLGADTVREHLAKGVYEESDGAVVFRGEPYGLHTRVFINSQGLPTYEAKDVGLIMRKWQDYQFDTSVIITGNDIIEYMKVVLKSIEQYMPELAERTKHITHGQIKLAGGIKMSSRKGNVLFATDILDSAQHAANAINQNNSEQVANAAVKYAFLKQRTGGDIIYDPAESVSMEGNSGPYLQYAHARAKSIVRKAQDAPREWQKFDDAERLFALKLSEYNEVFARAVADYTPHIICTYLYELAQVFNRFYENNRVIDNERQAIRLQLIDIYAAHLASGLALLGIHAPEQM